MRTGRPRSTWVNETYFDSMDAERWYWLGFIMADGSVTMQPGRSWQLTASLATQDKAHLEALHGRLGGALNPMGQNAWRLIVCSKRLVTRLFELGVAPRKSWEPKELTSEHKNIPFLRGLFDGDGCLHICKRGYLSAHFCGHPQLAQWFADAMNLAPVSFRKRGNTLYVQWTSGPAARALAKKLYVRDGGPQLARKARIAEVSDAARSPVGGLYR